jgi:hypothetical protein|tara:strand:- start:684 stop:854 length:171 start_codon:yes stop_codon:yes gene_type:complete
MVGTGADRHANSGRRSNSIRPAVDTLHGVFAMVGEVTLVAVPLLAFVPLRLRYSWH